MKKLLILAVVFITSCSTVSYRMSVDPSLPTQIENRIRTNLVKQYTNYQIWQLEADMVGMVESEHCRKNQRDYDVKTDYLISVLKVKTQKLGGNGLVYDSCEVREPGALCYTHTKCRGMAYVVHND